MPHILLSENDPSVRGLLIRFLGLHGYAVTVIDDPSAPELSIETYRYDALLIDLVLPLRPLAMSLRRDRRSAPLLLMTRYGRDQLEPVAALLEPDDILYKPFSMDEAVTALRRMVYTSPTHSPRPTTSTDCRQWGSTIGIGLCTERYDGRYPTNRPVPLGGLAPRRERPGA
ncbi:MAG: response regulator [Dehalococcoidia bacterium]|nr:MAG: response regulator [Dehalococcoidia bacterium]